jgi:RNA polymerase sigma-70 factor (ECF subfamily)
VPGGRDFIILPEDHPTRNGYHHQVNAGRKHMSSTNTQLSVIDGVCRQDPQRWREFDAIYRPILRAFLHNRGLRDFEASDVIQDVFVKVLGKINTYNRTQYRFRTWLFTIAHRTLIDHARRRASHDKALHGWAAQMLKASPSDSVKMEEEWIVIHREKILKHALKIVRARVSPRSWACFEHRLLKDRPAAEIARDLKIEPNAVYVNACRVLKLVRSICDDFDEDMSYAFESDLSRGS